MAESTSQDPESAARRGESSKTWKFLYEHIAARVDSRLLFRVMSEKCLRGEMRESI